MIVFNKKTIKPASQLSIFSPHFNKLQQYVTSLLYSVRCLHTVLGLQPVWWKPSLFSLRKGCFNSKCLFSLLGTMLALANFSMQMTRRLRAISSLGLTKAANTSALITSGWGESLHRQFAYSNQIKLMNCIKMIKCAYIIYNFKCQYNTMSFKEMQKLQSNY